MSDSIFDLTQTLFTSNLPAPAPRDRSTDGGANFDQALDSAQRQNHGHSQTHESQQPQVADNQKTDDTDQADEAQPADRDEVTLTKDGTKAEPEIVTAVTAEQAVVEKAVVESAVVEPAVIEETEEPTAAEIATAVVVPLDSTKLVIKESEEVQSNEEQESSVLSDAIQLDDKTSRNKLKGKEVPTANAVTNTAPVQDVKPNETATDEAPATDSNAVVVATELHSTKVPPTNKNERAVNKPEQIKSGNAAKTTPTNDEEIKPDSGDYSEGSFAVTVIPESEVEARAPKRRAELTRQSIPEVQTSELQLASTFATNAAAAAASHITHPLNTATTAAVETTPKPAETPVIPAVSTTTTESTALPNHLRGTPIPNSFANRLEAASAERKSNDPLNGVDRTRFVQRVARAFQRVGETEGEIRLRLSPPELGAVKLEVSLRDGAMIARMETETTTARNLLMDNLPQLKERLAEQNVRIETFEVEVRDQANQSSADDAREQLLQQTEQQRNRLRGERATTPVVAQPIVRTLPAARQSSQLNVVI